MTATQPEGLNMTDELIKALWQKANGAKPDGVLFHMVRDFTAELLSASKPAAPVQSREPFGYAPLPEYEQAIDGQYKRSCVTVSRKPGGAFQIPLYCAPQPCGDAEQADEAVSVDLIAKWARRMTLSLSDSECVALVQEILAARAKDRK